MGIVNFAQLLAFFAKMSLGHLRRHRLEAALCLAGVALGVTVAVAIDSAVQACIESFHGAVTSLAERSTHSIFGDSGFITDEQYIALLHRRFPFPLAPVIDRGVLVHAGPAADEPVHPAANLNQPPGDADTTRTAGGSNPSGGEIVARLLGVDIFSERRLRTFTQVQLKLDRAALRAFLTEPAQVVLVAPLARQLGISIGATVMLTIGQRRLPVHVCGIIEPTGVARAQLTDVMIADLATAQELADSLGRVDRIDASLDNPMEVASLEAALPVGLQLQSTSRQSESLDELIGSYRLNLTALSMMASFVAVFIVYNAMLVSVQQRSRTLGVLRSLGASKSQLGGIYLAESVLFALVGGALGVVGGWGLSHVLLGFIATTINDLYATVRPGSVQLGAATWIKGMSISLASCLVGAGVPLARAARSAPITAVRRTARAAASRRAATSLLVAGIVLLAGSGLLARWPSDSPTIGFAIAVLVALGFAFCCPWLVWIVGRAVAAAARPRQMLPVQMAASGVARSLGITGIAVAATMLALAMNVSIRTMVQSFRDTLDRWVDQRFGADIFVSPELTFEHHIAATIDPAVAAWVAGQPETTESIAQRRTDIDLAGKSVLLGATDVARLLAENSIPVKQWAPGRAAAAFDPSLDVLISEPLAGRLHLAAGQSLTLESPSGPRSFFVLSVFYDFGTERGQVMLDRQTYAMLWRDQRIDSLRIRLTPGTNAATVASNWQAELRPRFPVTVTSFVALKVEVLTVFDRTFKVTEVLAWLAGGVAFCGMAGSLLAVALERRQDYAVLAAVGMSARQTVIWVTSQALLIAWISAAVSAVAGTVLAYVLADVIQYRSFGWSIPTAPQPRFWAEALWLATAAAVVAAAYPIARLCRTAPAVSLREE